jgi:DNA-binding MarR family transcriptional regulator
MKPQTITPAARAESSAAPIDSTLPPTKIRGTRRMARQSAAENAADQAPAAEPGKARAETKIAKVIALLGRGEGATLAELVEATGWQPHTTRAALTGLKKKGHVISKTKRGEATCYLIGPAV